MTDLRDYGEEKKDEVRKLQDLVDKLEKQNEILRQKADNYSQVTVPSTKSNTLQQHGEGSHTDTENGTEGVGRTSVHGNTKLRKNSRSVSESMGDLDLHSDADDDDTWLYTSPLKAPTPDQKSVSPYDWIRQDFERPNYDMESARKSLLAKLDEVSRANRNSLNLSKPQPIPEAELPQDEVEPMSSPSHKTHERKTSGEERLFKKLEDVTDVQILAKMQEESLRQALHQSPGTSPRTKMTVSPATSEKNSSSRTSSQGSMEGVTEEKGDAEKITAATGVVRRRPSFERAKKEEHRRHSYGAKLSMGSGMNNGDHLQASDLPKLALVPSPSEQPSSVKGSLPEMNRTYNSKRTESEPPPPPPPTPCTENEPDLREPSAPSGNHASPTKGSLRQPSPTHGRIPTPNRRGIPVRSSPAQRTGIPRPRSSAYPKSQLPMPGSKSSIPSRRTSPQVRDEDWKDGCY